MRRLSTLLGGEVEQARRACPSGSAGCRRAACRPAQSPAAGAPAAHRRRPWRRGRAGRRRPGLVARCADMADRRDVARRRCGASSATRVRPSASTVARSASAASAALAAGRIGDDADPVAARRLAARQVADVPEQSADRRAQHVQDVEGEPPSAVHTLLTLAAASDGQRAHPVTKSLQKTDHERRAGAHVRSGKAKRQQD